MPSYSYLCKKAGLPAPSGFAVIDRAPRKVPCQPTPRALASRRITKMAQEKEWLRVQLDAMVQRGELYKTPDGRYGLPEWLNAEKTSSASTAANSSRPT